MERQIGIFVSGIENIKKNRDVSIEEVVVAEEKVVFSPRQQQSSQERPPGLRIVLSPTTGTDSNKTSLVMTSVSTPDKTLQLSTNCMSASKSKKEKHDRCH